MSRFAEPRQGKGPLYPKTGRAAVAACLVGISYSTLLYPHELKASQELRVSTHLKDAVPIRCMPSPAERINITVTRVADLQLSDVGIPQGLKLLYEMGQDILRQERECNVVGR
jgi:hypothetical protein